MIATTAVVVMMVALAGICTGKIAASNFQNRCTMIETNTSKTLFTLDEPESSICGFIYLLYPCEWCSDTIFGLSTFLTLCIGMIAYS